jgi:hypothetical protein
MEGYANIKIRKLLKFIKFLDKHNDIEIKCGGKHQILIKYTYGQRPFPIPCHSGDVNKNIVNDLVNLVVKEWQVCTQEEVDKFLK